MVKVVRTKGLMSRHWRQIANALQISIDPTSTTLLKLIALGFHEPEKLKIIRAITDVAAREYAVQIATEELEAEVRGMNFQFDIGPILGTKTCRKLMDVSARFEEFVLRSSVLKSNPYVKNFFDRLQDLERTVKSVVEILAEWVFL